MRVAQTRFSNMSVIDQMNVRLITVMFWQGSLCVGFNYADSHYNTDSNKCAPDWQFSVLCVHSIRVEC